MRSILIAGALALSGCQTVSINGMKIEPGEQFAWGLAGIVVASAIYHLAEDDASKSDQCKTYSAPLDLKGGEAFCAIPLD